MNVIRHQRVGGQGAALFFQGYTEPVEVSVTIFFRVKTSLAVMPALHDVQRNFTQMSAGATEHGSCYQNDPSLAPLICALHHLCHPCGMGFRGDFGQWHRSASRQAGRHRDHCDLCGLP